MSSKDDPEINPEINPGTGPEIPDKLDDFTFDEWCELHDSDPERFESCRLKMLNDLIDAAPDESKPRLRGLMFKMEGESRRSKSQLGYNLRLSSMMMEMLDELREQLYLLSVGDISEIEKASMRPSGAEVIPFERAAGKNE